MSNIFHLGNTDAKQQITDTFGSEAKFCYSQADIKAAHSYMVTDNMSPLDCLSVIRDRKITNVVQNSIQCLSDKLQFLKTIDYKFEDYFDPKLSLLSGDVVCVPFMLTEDRTEVIQKAFLQAYLDLDMTKYQYLFQVATELVMNAQIDAPKISKKTNVANSMLIVEKNMAKGLVSISTIDHYGSLDPYKMLENIYAANKNGFRDSMSKNSIGAGLGSALIYEHTDSLVMGVIPDVMTRVSAILPYGVSEKKINQIQKSIHIIKG
ncbi:hypothetical protein CIK05_05820 [Bdellovibrio sp. qaytius]|nr:hypothetical protein CIK05_05820 [Bdellovibrio sp. qaytius]